MDFTSSSVSMRYCTLSDSTPSMTPAATLFAVLHSLSSSQYVFSSSADGTGVTVTLGVVVAPAVAAGTTWV
jgi:hypothetical protein